MILSYSTNTSSIVKEEGLALGAKKRSESGFEGVGLRSKEKKKP